MKKLYYFGRDVFTVIATMGLFTVGFWFISRGMCWMTGEAKRRFFKN